MSAEQEKEMSPREPAGLLVLDIMAACKSSVELVFLGHGEETCTVSYRGRHSENPCTCMWGMSVGCCRGGDTLLSGSRSNEGFPEGAGKERRLAEM